MIGNSIYTQLEAFNNGTPCLLIKIHDDLRFETFHYGAKCTVPALVKLRVTRITVWSTFDEIVKYLVHIEPDRHKQVLNEHLSAMGPVSVACPSTQMILW